MKVKRPIEDTRFEFGLIVPLSVIIAICCYVILVNLPNNEYLYNYIIFFVFYKGAMNIAASIRCIL